MQKVIVVSKTHLDLGFTDYAEHIYHKYLDEFIPNAVSIANELNADGSKRFVWTTGSWLLKEALKNGSEQNRQALLQGLRSGNIAPHAMPFTTHTEPTRSIMASPSSIKSTMSLAAKPLPRK